VIQLFSGKIAEIQTLVQSGVGLMALVMVGVVWAKTKAFVPTLGALLFGAIVIWGVHNTDFLQQKIGQDMQQGLAATTATSPIR
jgi:hypothetical protein